MKFFLAIAITIMLFASCENKNENSNSPVEITLQNYLAPADSGLQNGGVKIIPIKTAKGIFNVWTKTVGNNPKIKILLLHGGPGATHEYFECVENFFPQQAIEFIYYDQLGSGNSDNPADTSLWNLARFVDELEQVRIALKLDSTNFYLLGHSWGGILAMEYALTYQSKIKGLIISNMMASCPAYGKYADDVLSKTMDAKVLDTIRMIEAKGDFQNPKYMELLMPNFYAQHLLRLPIDQWPEPVNRSFAKSNQQVYVMMQGPSEFGIAGNLENWDRSADLKNISVPTLVIGGTYDTMDPEYMKWMSAQFQKGRFLLCEKGSHMDMWDDQQTWMKGVIKFMKDVDAGNFSSGK